MVYIRILCRVEKDANVHIITGVLSDKDFVNIVQLISKSDLDENKKEDEYSIIISNSLIKKQKDIV